MVAKENAKGNVSVKLLLEFVYHSVTKIRVKSVKTNSDAYMYLIRLFIYIFRSNIILMWHSSHSAVCPAVCEPLSDTYVDQKWAFGEAHRFTPCQCNFSHFVLVNPVSVTRVQSTPIVAGFAFLYLYPVWAPFLPVWPLFWLLRCPHGSKSEVNQECRPLLRFSYNRSLLGVRRTISDLYDPLFDPFDPVWPLKSSKTGQNRSKPKIDATIEVLRQNN